MKEPIEDVIKKQILTPLASLTLSSEEEELVKKGFVYEKSPEILTRGHITSRVKRIVAGSQVADFLFSPIKFSFPKVISIYGIIFKFIRSFKCRNGKHVESSHRFLMFPAISSHDRPQGENVFLLEEVKKNHQVL